MADSLGAVFRALAEREGHHGPDDAAAYAARRLGVGSLPPGLADELTPRSAAVAQRLAGRYRLAGSALWLLLREHDALARA